jgi:hypothetical protein
LQPPLRLQFKRNASDIESLELKLERHGMGGAADPDLRKLIVA